MADFHHPKLRLLKGDELTHTELDNNINSFYYSSSLDGSNIKLYAGSTSGSFFGYTQSYDVNAFTASHATSASYADLALTASYAISSSVEVTLEHSSSYAESASFADNTNTALTASHFADGIVTASAANNIITFTKDDSSTFALTVTTGSLDGVLSSSAQIAEDISGSLSNVAISALEAGIVSASAQIRDRLVSAGAFTSASNASIRATLGTNQFILSGSKPDTNTLRLHPAAGTNLDYEVGGEDLRLQAVLDLTGSVLTETGSVKTRLNTIEAATSSYALIADISGSGNVRFEALNAITGSLIKNAALSGSTTNTIRFTQQDDSTIDITINTGSSVDSRIVGLLTESGSVKTRLNTIEAATSSYALKTEVSGSGNVRFEALNAATSSYALKTDISGSGNIRFEALNAITGSLIKNAALSGSTTNTIRFTQQDDSTIDITINTGSSPTSIDSASHAEFADLAHVANSATTATTASYALFAVSASHEIITETFSTTAGTANTASHAEFADLAHVANSATTATTATSASHSEFADLAHVANSTTTATSASHSEFADLAHLANSATTATTATSASHSEFADLAHLANSATTATSASHALKANSANANYYSSSISGDTLTLFSYNGSHTIAIDDDNDNTFRTVKVDTNNDGTANATLGATEQLKLIGGTNVTLAEDAGKVTITAAGTAATNLSKTVSGTGFAINSSTGDNIALSLADTTNWGLMSDEMFDKLDGIEASADVTDATNVKANMPSGVPSGSASQARSQIGAGTGNGTVTEVTVGTGLDIANGTTTPTMSLDLTEITLGAGLDSTATGLSLDLSELTDMTAAVNGAQDELIILDNGAERRKLVSEITLSDFNNDSGFTSNTGTVDTSGTPAAQQVALFTDANTISGSTNLKMHVNGSYPQFNGLQVGDGGTANLYLGNAIDPSSANKGARFHSNDNDFYFDFQGDATQNWYLRDYDGSGGTHTRFTFDFINSNFAAATATFSGNVTANNFVTTSDRELKDNIVPIKEGLETLKKFVSYEYELEGRKDAGFIAQEVEESLSYAVHKKQDGYLALDTKPILAHMHKAILEIDQRLSAIEDKLK